MSNQNQRKISYPMIFIGYFDPDNLRSFDLHFHNINQNKFESNINIPNESLPCFVGSRIIVDVQIVDKNKKITICIKEYTYDLDNYSREKFLPSLYKSLSQNILTKKENSTSFSSSTLNYDSTRYYPTFIDDLDIYNQEEILGHLTYRAKTCSFSTKFGEKYFIDQSLLDYKNIISEILNKEDSFEIFQLIEKNIINEDKK